MFDDEHSFDSRLANQKAEINSVHLRCKFAKLSVAFYVYVNGEL